jgi:hypothetical protein
VLSAALSAASVSVTDEVVVPVPRDEFNQVNEHLGGTWSIYDSTTGEPAVVPDYIVKEVTFPVRNLLSVEGLRFFFSAFVDNFAGFGVVAVVLVARDGHDHLVGDAHARGGQRSREHRDEGDEIDEHERRVGDLVAHALDPGENPGGRFLARGRYSIYLVRHRGTPALDGRRGASCTAS